MQDWAIAEGEDRVWPCETNGKTNKADLEVEHEVILVTQWDTYSVDTLRNKKMS